jgi:hypothetical protein
VFTQHCKSVDRVIESNSNSGEGSSIQNEASQGSGDRYSEVYKQGNLHTLKETCDELYLIWN